MLSWAIGFFIVAIIAAIFGFTGIAGAAAGIAKVLFWLFLIAFVASLVMGYRGRGGGPGTPPAVYQARQKKSGLRPRFFCCPRRRFGASCGPHFPGRRL